MRRLIWLVPFALWCALVAILLPRHEPWFDELQAWMLVKGSSLRELLVDRLRYEGTPGLWHLLLWPFARLDFPLITLQIAGAVAAAAAAFLIFVYSPLPWLLRLLVPFAFFPFYQYAVVARNYCLLFLAVALVALAWRRRLDRPGWLAAALLILANVSAHGILIAGGAALAFALEARRQWPALGETQKKRLVRAAAAFSLAVPVLLVQLWPHEDCAFTHDSYPTLAHRLGQAGRMTVGAFSDNVGITLALVVASGAWFARRHVLGLWLLTTLPVLIFFGTVIARPWHQGAIFAAWLLALWVSFEGAPKRGLGVGTVTVASVVMLAVQLNWSARTWMRDYGAPYSGSRAAGLWLFEQGLDRQPLFGLGFASYAVLPYTRATTFVNALNGRSYWLWSKKESGLHDLKAVARDKPQWIVRAQKLGEEDWLPVPGYTVVATFPGALLFKGYDLEPDRYEILERSTMPSASK